MNIVYRKNLERILSVTEIDGNFEQLEAAVLLLQAASSGTLFEFESTTEAMAVTPLPANNVPFIVRGTTNGTEDGYYIYNSNEAGGYFKTGDFKTPGLTQTLEPTNTTEAPSNKAVADYNAAQRGGEVAEGETRDVSGGEVFTALESKPNLIVDDLTLIYHSDSRINISTLKPGYSRIASSLSYSYEPVLVKGSATYFFENCTHNFSSGGNLTFLDKNGQTLGYLTGSALIPFTTPKDCYSIIFGVRKSSVGANFKLAKVTKEIEGYESVLSTKTNGVNLTDGSFYYIKYDDVNNGFAIDKSFAMSTPFNVSENKKYYIYKSLNITGDILLLDENNVVLQTLVPDIKSYSTNDLLIRISIPDGVGDNCKVMFRVIRYASDIDLIADGTIQWMAVEESNYNVLNNIIEGTYDSMKADEVGKLIDLRKPIEKNFNNKSFLMIGDSVYATQNHVNEAYYESEIYEQSSQGTNRTVGGCNAEILRRLKPYSWTNYSNGGWTLTYSGAYFGQDIYLNGDSGNYLYALERFIFDYDNYIANPLTTPIRFAPDVLFISSCINDFAKTGSWVTDAEISASGKSYDQYMEDTFVSSGALNDTLIPLENINLNKIAGALRYMIERIYRKFPKCYICVVTSNKTSNHSREGQYKTTRDMIWMANRLNSQVIDVFNSGSQLNMLRELRDSVTGTRDDLYLTQDGIHDYGSVGLGYQRHGRFITNELVKGYFDLEDFIL